MKNKLLIFGIIIIISASFYFTITYLTKQGSVSLAKPLEKMPKRGYAVMNADFEFMKIRDPFSNSIPKNIKSRELKFASKLPVKASHKDQTWNWRGPH